MNYRIITLIILFSASLAATSSAQDAELITDRPDLTESPNAVPVGSLQVELGATTFDSDSFRVNTIGEILLRYGFVRNFELRVGVPSVISGDVESSGLSDAYVGVKWQLGKIGSGEVGLIATLSLPTGDDDFTSDGVEPSVILTAGTQLTESISLASQIEGAYNTAGDDRDLDFAATVVLGFPINSRLGGFAELAAAAPQEGDEELLFHAGLLVALGADLQLDIHGGLGLTDGAPDSFYGIGLSFRR